MNAEKSDEKFYREVAKDAKESMNLIQSIWTQISSEKADRAACKHKDL
jgi:hypothetical protein